jgi:SagB-type dehydrogenase family enzyme
MMVLVLTPTAPASRALGSERAGGPPSSRLLTRVLTLLQERPLPLPQVERLAARDPSDPVEQALLYLVLKTLAQTGRIEVEIRAHKTPLARLRGALPEPTPAVRLPLLRLSRFAVLRPHNGSLIVESPFSAASVVLLDELGSRLCAQLAAGLTRARRQTLADLATDRAALDELVMALAAIGALEDPSGDEGALAQWEPHDALFHARSRAGRTAAPHGGTLRFAGKRPPEPAIPQRAFGPATALPQLPLSQEAAALRELLLRRRSIRRYGPRPLAAAALGTLLRLVARNTAFEPAEPEKDKPYETLYRPYPSGGGCHELHIYPVVHRCQDLARGIYYYDGASDRLLTVAPPSDAGERLLRGAARSMGSAGVPDVLLCIAARFARVNWKYQGLAYALILKNVGVLMQSLYLMATALHLAPCALGCGNTQDFLAATAGQAFVEESVGELALGSHPDSG